MNPNIRDLLNFSKNVRPLMLKLHKATKPLTLTPEEMSRISNFYLEVADMLSRIEDEGEDA